MLQNSYEGVVEPWKLELIEARVKALGVRAQDVDDVVQEIVLEILGFTFDASKSNGCKESTVLMALIDRQILMFRRGQARYRKYCDCLARKRQDSSRQEHLDVQLDVRAVLEKQAPRDREIANLLGLGCSEQEMGAELDLTRETLRSAERRIQRALDLNGLDPAQ